MPFFIWQEVLRANLEELTLFKHGGFPFLTNETFFDCVDYELKYIILE